jgi:prepilin-type N-terminal cleavage/methylation domain-containing protein
MVKNSGFSLIELIVVIGLLSLLTLAISSIMLTSVITSTRIRTTTKVKQAGNYALGQIQSMIRNAKTVTECDSSGYAIEIVGSDGGSTRLLSEIDSVSGITRIASNSGTYLTPATTTVNGFVLTCSPSDTEPTLVKVSFDLQDNGSETSTRNPSLHFETSVNLRNE